MSDELQKEEVKQEVKQENNEELIIKEDVSGLKSALQKEREARKEYEKRLKVLEAEKESEKQKALEQNGQWKELAESRQAKIDDLTKQLVDGSKKSRADAIVASLTKDEKKGKLLRQEILKNLDYNDGQVVITLAGVSDEKGLQEYYRENFGFLVDGSKAAGGGATGNDGGGTSGNVLTNDQFEAKTPQEKMKFIRSGGVIKD